MLDQGFDVTVVDKNPLMGVMANRIASKKMHYFVTTFAKFEFAPAKYDLASAIYSLPFMQPSDFERVFANIVISLKLTESSAVNSSA